MIRTKAGKALTLVAAALCTGAVVTNCSKGHKGDDMGHVALALTLPGGIVVNSVSYQVTNAGGTTLLNSSFDVSDPNAIPSLDLVLPPSVGDQITLTATSVGTPTRTFTGSATFTVLSGTQIHVDVTLTDTVGAATPPGTVIVDGHIVPGNNAPVINSVVVAPNQTSAGANIAVTVSATDPDGDTLTYAWTASNGTFAAPTAASTTYSSTVGGAQTIIITVTDSHGASTASMPQPVNIIGGSTGGTGGAGGTPTGGTGGTPTGGTGGTPTGGTGGTPTGGTGGTPTGGTGGTPTGGTGGGGSAGFVNMCPAAEPAATPTCSSCAAGNCSLGSAGTDGCCGLASASDQLLCIAVVQCFTNNAATCVSSGDGTNCFCGTSGGACFMTAGVANGPCTTEVIAAAKTSVPASIQGQFTSPGSPLGRAVNLIGCEGNFCNTECNIN